MSMTKGAGVKGSGSGTFTVDAGFAKLSGMFLP